MTVYVDNARHPYGRMIMCHMVSESPDELHAMADRIGVARKWFHRHHYNICLAKRALAVAAGAVEITKRHAAVIRHNFRLNRIIEECEPSSPTGETPTPQETSPTSSSSALIDTACISTPSK